MLGFARSCLVNAMDDRRLPRPDSFAFLHIGLSNSVPTLTVALPVRLIRGLGRMRGYNVNILNFHAKTSHKIL